MTDAGDRHLGDDTPNVAGDPALRLPGAFSDPAEVQRMWRDHRRWVAAILLAHKPREADVEDLLQTVAVSVVRKIGELRDPGALKPWLRTVAINAARAAGRQTQRTRKKLRLAQQEVAAAGEGAEAGDRVSADRDEGRKLLELARTMPDGYREPLLLRCVQGMSYRQISEVTGLPETTIETRIARGRRMLRELASKREGAGLKPASEAAAKSGRPSSVRTLAV